MIIKNESVALRIVHLGARYYRGDRNAHVCHVKCGL
jgi:hypothetical protein